MITNIEIKLTINDRATSHFRLHFNYQINIKILSKLEIALLHNQLTLTGSDHVTLNPSIVYFCQLFHDAYQSSFQLHPN